MLESREYHLTPLETQSFVPYLVQKVSLKPHIVEGEGAWHGLLVQFLFAFFVAYGLPGPE